MAVFGNPATNQTEQLYGDVKLGSVVTPYSANYWLVWHSAKLAQCQVGTVPSWYPAKLVLCQVGIVPSWYCAKLVPC